MSIEFTNYYSESEPDKITVSPGEKTKIRLTLNSIPDDNVHTVFMGYCLEDNSGGFLVEYTVSEITYPLPKNAVIDDGVCLKTINSVIINEGEVGELELAHENHLIVYEHTSGNNVSLPKGFLNIE